MSNKEIIKNYLEEQCKSDAALAEKYDPKKLDAMMKAITEEARKIAVKSCAMVQDATVYKWARDFFIDGKAEASPEDNAVTEAAATEDSDEDTAAPAPVPAFEIEKIRKEAKAEALKEFRAEAKAKAEEAAAKKAAAKAEKEAAKAEKEAAKAAEAQKLADEQANIISLF